MGHRKRRSQRRATSTALRHRVGLVALIAVLLFLADLTLTLFREGDLRGALLTSGVAIGLVAITAWGGRRG